MNITYLIYEAERPRSMAEQRETDVRAGEFAAGVARLGRSLRHPASAKQNARRDAERRAGSALHAVPRPRQPVER
ncbi:MAG: hypothetical protein ACRDNO_07545 [Trebonia sp.]